MKRKRFNPILVIFIASLILASVSYLYESSNIFQDTILYIRGFFDKNYQISCSALGWKENSYVIFWNKKKPVNLNVRQTDKINAALSSVIPELPPAYNPAMLICPTDADNILITEGGYKTNPADLFVLRLTKNYDLKNTVHLKVEDQVAEFYVLSYSKDGTLYLRARGINNALGRSTSSIFKVVFNSNKYEVVERKELNY